MQDINHIENFIQGNLSPLETANFKAELDANPTLQKEVSMQQDAMKGIQEHRRLELKTRLSNIAVSAGLSTMHKTLISGAAALVLLIGYTSYEYLDGNSEVVTNNPTDASPMLEAPMTTSATELETELFGIPEVEKEVTIQINEELEVEESLNISSSESDNETPTPNNFTNLNAPVIDEFNLEEGTDFNKSYDSEERGDISANGDNSDIKGVSPVFKEPHAHKLSYNWNNDNLTLFGKFNKSEPYLLIDLADSKELYLKYQGDFYKLEESNSEKKKIILLESKVTDPFLIRDLIKKSK